MTISKIIFRGFMIAALVFAVMTFVFGYYLRRNQILTTVSLEFTGTPPTWDEVAATRDVLRKRIELLHRLYDVGRSVVRIQPGPRLDVTLASRTRPDELIDKLANSGRVELKLVAELREMTRAVESGVVPDGFELKTYTEPEFDMTRPGTINTREEELLLHVEPLLVCQPLKHVKHYTEGMQRRPIIDIEFSDADREAFASITADNINRRIALVVGGEVQVAPEVTAPVEHGRVHIEHIRIPLKALTIARLLEAGPLPRDLRVTCVRVESRLQQQAPSQPEPTAAP